MRTRRAGSATTVGLYVLAFAGIATAGTAVVALVVAARSAPVTQWQRLQSARASGHLRLSAAPFSSASCGAFRRRELADASAPATSGVIAVR